MKNAYNSEYYPQLRGVIVISIICFLLAIISIIIWFDSRSNIFILFFLVSVIGFIIFFYPVLSKQTVMIRGSHVIFRYRTKPTLKFKIEKSLKQIVIKNDEIKHFRFELGNKVAQLSPSAYKNGNELQYRLVKSLKNNEITFKVIEK